MAKQPFTSVPTPLHVASNMTDIVSLALLLVCACFVVVSVHGIIQEE